MGLLEGHVRGQKRLKKDKKVDNFKVYVIAKSGQMSSSPKRKVSKVKTSPNCMSTHPYVLGVVS